MQHHWSLVCRHLLVVHTIVKICSTDIANWLGSSENEWYTTNSETCWGQPFQVQQTSCFLNKPSPRRWRNIGVQERSISIRQFFTIVCGGGKSVLSTPEPSLRKDRAMHRPAAEYIYIHIYVLYMYIEDYWKLISKLTRWIEARHLSQTRPIILAITNTS